MPLFIYFLLLNLSMPTASNGGNVRERSTGKKQFFLCTAQCKDVISPNLGEYTLYRSQVSGQQRSSSTDRGQ